MLPNGISRVFRFLTLVGVLVSGYAVYRLSKVDATSVVPPVNPKRAIENYRARMRATERLLETERL